VLELETARPSPQFTPPLPNSLLLTEIRGRFKCEKAPHLESGIDPDHTEIK